MCGKGVMMDKLVNTQVISTFSLKPAASENKKTDFVEVSYSVEMLLHSWELAVASMCG